MASNMEHFQPLACEFAWVANPGKLMASNFQTLVSEFACLAPLRTLMASNMERFQPLASELGFSGPFPWQVRVLFFLCNL
jgi:hypothetical protein